MCWLDILLLATYNAATTFITKGGFFCDSSPRPEVCGNKGGLLLQGRCSFLQNSHKTIAVVYLNLRKKRVKERSPQCRIFKIACQVQQKYSSDK
jgi:hypothetical protein